MRHLSAPFLVMAFLISGFLITSHPSSVNAQGFFSTDGPDIVNGAGEPVVMRGVGLGGWLMPEGYMFDIAAPDGGSPTSIRNQILDLIGPADTETFYELFEENFVNENDIAAIAAWGYDHIRLPFHYNVFYDDVTSTFKEDGFAQLDEFLDWCRTHGLYVILDMHAAPGAQSASNISDSDGVARLWTEPVPHKQQTIDIWAEIANRYKADTLIIGYDLINEPVLPNGMSADSLRSLYVQITEAIRAVDTNHTVYIEGNWYATDFTSLTPPFDSNMVYAFHKYWNHPNVGTIQYLIDMRAEHQVPLWLGESGENSNPWFEATTRLAENHSIGWNWWTHKQIDATASALSARVTPGYRKVIDYWRGSAARPSAAVAKEGLFSMARALHIDSTDVNRGVLAALFDPDFPTLREPFKEHHIPGIVNAADYDLGNQGTTYSDAMYQAVSGTPGGGNNGGQYRNDGVDIERSTDPRGFEYNVGWMDVLEWLTYTVTVDSTGSYDMEARVASLNGGGEFRVQLDGVQLGDPVLVPSTGGWQNWVSVWIRDVPMDAGEHTLKVLVRKDGFNLNRMIFTKASTVGTDDESQDFGVDVHSPFPNPFAERVSIPIDTGRGSTVSVNVYDLLGRVVYKHRSEQLPPGTHLVSIEPSLATGAYLFRVVVTDPDKSHVFWHRVVATR